MHRNFVEFLISFSVLYVSQAVLHHHMLFGFLDPRIAFARDHFQRIIGDSSIDKKSFDRIGIIEAIAFEMAKEMNMPNIEVKITNETAVGNKVLGMLANSYLPDRPCVLLTESEAKGNLSNVVFTMSHQLGVIKNHEFTSTWIANFKDECFLRSYDLFGFPLLPWYLLQRPMVDAIRNEAIREIDSRAELNAIRQCGPRHDNDIMKESLCDILDTIDVLTSMVMSMHVVEPPPLFRLLESKFHDFVQEVAVQHMSPALRR